MAPRRIKAWNKIKANNEENENDRRSRMNNLTMRLKYLYPQFKIWFISYISIQKRISFNSCYFSQQVSDTFQILDSRSTDCPKWHTCVNFTLPAEMN